MSRTVLFFGDSNTRGYGGPVDKRFTALLERAVEGRTQAPWNFAVVAAASDLRVIPERVVAAVDRHAPDLIVWSCPAGPLTYAINFPPAVERLRSVVQRWVKRSRERAIDAESAQEPAGSRTRKEIERDGLFVQDVFRYRPRHRPVIRQVRALLVRRYGLRVKATRERYLQRLVEFRDLVRQRTEAPILFLSPFLMCELVSPGYAARAREWTVDLASLLADESRGSHYLDLVEPLQSFDPDEMLLNDGIHLAPTAHRRVADLVLPVLLELMQARETASPARSG